MKEREHTTSFWPAASTHDQVSFVAGDMRGHETPAIGPIEGTGAESEMPQDIALGSAIGLAAGLVALVIPGVGPFIAAGPLAAAMGGLPRGPGSAESSDC